MFWVLKKTSHGDSSFAYPQHMFRWKMKIIFSFALLSGGLVDTDSKNNKCLILFSAYRGSYMSAHVLLNLLNELGKRDKMQGLPSILFLFRNKFNKFNNTRAQMLDSIYHMAKSLKSHFWLKNVIILSLCMQRCYQSRNVSRKSINQ